MALSESDEARNTYPGLYTSGSDSPANWYGGLYLGDTEVADNQLDPGAIGPNNPRPGEGATTTAADIVPLG